MIHETLSKIESTLNHRDITESKRAEILELVNQLKNEIEGLSQTNVEGAQSVVSFAEISTHEASRSEKNPALLDASLKGLSSSVAEFEESHPQLVAVVNRISTVLSNMGV